jgi:acetyl-CoA synthetase
MQSSDNIAKPAIESFKVTPNLDHANPAELGWDQVQAEMDWLPGGGLNQAHEAIDRHANGRLRDKLAMIWVGRGGERQEYTFGQMKAQSNRFAGVLRSLGVETGDRVFILLERIPELYVAFLGTLKTGAIAAPLFADTGPETIRDVLRDCGAKVLVTNPEIRRRFSGVLPELFDLQHIVVVNRADRDPAPKEPQDLDYYEEMEKAPADFTIASTSAYDYAVINYTSGATGEPRAVVHRHQACVQHYATGKWVLDLHPDDIYWCTADPGWATGTSYGITAPWTNGITQLIYEGPFGADDWYELIEKHKVSVWYTAPTAIRMLMKAGDALPQGHDLSSLRFAASVGGPLAAREVAWGEAVIGAPFHDTWWQTETGAIMCANYAAMPIKPGSMGKPVPGVRLAVLDEDLNPAPAGAEGLLAARPGWPSMFATYRGDAALYNSRFKKGWYITGDRARIDPDGYFWFVGRE